MSPPARRFPTDSAARWIEPRVPVQPMRTGPFAVTGNSAHSEKRSVLCELRAHGGDRCDRSLRDHQRDRLPCPARDAVRSDHRDQARQDHLDSKKPLDRASEAVLAADRREPRFEARPSVPRTTICRTRRCPGSAGSGSIDHRLTKDSVPLLPKKSLYPSTSASRALAGDDVSVVPWVLRNSSNFSPAAKRVCAVTRAWSRPRRGRTTEAAHAVDRRRPIVDTTRPRCGSTRTRCHRSIRPPEMTRGG